MILYLAASCDTKKKVGAFAFKPGQYVINSSKSSNTTTPRELLRGLYELFTYLIKMGEDERFTEFTLVTNSEFIIDMVNDKKVFEWKESGWIKSNGEPVANVDLVKELYGLFMYYQERSKTIFATKPISPEEIAKFNLVAKAALAKRRE